jgi:hypothetical protein
MSDSDVDPGGLAGVFKKIMQFKDILVVGVIGFFGFGIGAFCVSCGWCIAWACHLGNTKKADADMNGYHPGDLIKQWGKAVGKAWHEFWN